MSLSIRSTEWAYVALDSIQTKFPFYNIDTLQSNEVQVVDREQGVNSGRITVVAIKTRTVMDSQKRFLMVTSDFVVKLISMSEFAISQREVRDITIPHDSQYLFISDLLAFMEREKLPMSNRCRTQYGLPLNANVVYQLSLPLDRRPHVRLDVHGAFMRDGSDLIDKIDIAPDKVSVKTVSHESGITALEIHFQQLDARERAIGCIENARLISRGDFRQNPGIQTVHLCFSVPKEFLSLEEQFVHDWLLKPMQATIFNGQDMSKLARKFRLELLEIPVKP